MAYFDRSFLFYFLVRLFSLPDVLNLASCRINLSSHRCVTYRRSVSLVRLRGSWWTRQPLNNAHRLAHGRKGSSSSSSALGPGSLRQRCRRCCGSLSSSPVPSFFVTRAMGFMTRASSSSRSLPLFFNSSTTLTDSGDCGDARSTLMVGMPPVTGLVPPVTGLIPQAWGSVMRKKTYYTLINLFIFLGSLL